MIGIRIKSKADLLLDTTINSVGYQENIQEDATIWAVPENGKMQKGKDFVLANATVRRVPAKARMMNLSMKRRKVFEQEPVTLKSSRKDSLQFATRVTCKICEKKLLLCNIGKHTKTVHCLLLREYEGIYGDVC